MEYDSFVEVIDDKGIAHHRYFDSKRKIEGRELNINEDYFLRLVFNNKHWDFNGINAVFNMMKDADDDKWAKAFSVLMMLKEK